jgi:hypothetical protein
MLSSSKYALISPFVIHHYAAPCHAVPSCLMQYRLKPCCILESAMPSYAPPSYAKINTFGVHCSGLISAAAAAAAAAAAFAAACKGTLDEFLGPYHGP